MNYLIKRRVCYLRMNEKTANLLGIIALIVFGLGGTVAGYSYYVYYIFSQEKPKNDCPIYGFDKCPQNCSNNFLSKLLSIENTLNEEFIQYTFNIYDSEGIQEIKSNYVISGKIMNITVGDTINLYQQCYYREKTLEYPNLIFVFQMPNAKTPDKNNHIYRKVEEEYNYDSILFAALTLLIFGPLFLMISTLIIAWIRDFIQNYYYIRKAPSENYLMTPV